MSSRSDERENISRCPYWADFVGVSRGVAEHRAIPARLRRFEHRWLKRRSATEACLRHRVASGDSGRRTSVSGPQRQSRWRSAQRPSVAVDLVDCRVRRLCRTIDRRARESDPARLLGLSFGGALAVDLRGGDPLDRRSDARRARKRRLPCPAIGRRCAGCQHHGCCAGDRRRRWASCQRRSPRRIRDRGARGPVASPRSRSAFMIRLSLGVSSTA